MRTIAILSLVAVTSVATYVVSVRRGRPGGGLGSALSRATTLVGAGVMFFAVNAVLGLLGVLAVRALTGHFVSVYVLNDISLLLVSLFQGVVFRLWWES